MKRAGRGLTRGFIRIMVLLGIIGVGLWSLGKIGEFAGRVPGGNIVAAGAMRYRQFAQTGN